MKFSEFSLGQEFSSSITISKEDFDAYISFARIKNRLHKDQELAAKEGITGKLVPGRAIIARAEGEMTCLEAFSDCIMLLYGMDGDTKWAGRQTRFLDQVYVGQRMDVKYKITSKKELDGYGILCIDFEVSMEGKPIVISRGNLYRLKV
jgi:acyl dehydratase